MAYHPFRNIPLKMLAVALSALLWYTVSRDDVVERNIRVPLEFQNIPQGLELTGDPPSTVSVRVRGASSVLSRLDSGDVVAVVDARTARTGPRIFHLLTDEVRVPFGVVVVQVAPATVPLTFERSGAKRVPVTAVVIGTAAPGFVARPPVADPAEVVVVGPESHLQGLTEATTEPVSIRDAMATVVDRVTVGVADAALRLHEPVMATVTVEVVPAPIERDVPGVTVRVRNLRPGLRTTISPAVVAAQLRGESRIVGQAAPETVDLHVDLNGLGPGRYTLPVRPGEAAGYTVVRITPASVRVRLQ